MHIHMVSMNVCVHKNVHFTRIILMCVLFLFQFRVHASHYYPLMCETMNYDLKHELRSIMKKFFVHVGHKFGIIHPDRRTT